MDVMRDCAPVVGWQFALCHDEKINTNCRQRFIAMMRQSTKLDGFFADVVAAYINKYGRRYAVAVAGCGRLPVIAVGVEVVFH
eukprot:scaffold39103_cov42-Cyclotella_meneghiniana.AAC.3